MSRAKFREYLVFERTYSDWDVMGNEFLDELLSPRQWLYMLP